PVAPPPGPPVMPPAADAAPPAAPPPPAAPGLSVRKTCSPQVLLFDPVAFRVEVANTGTTPLTDVVMTDILPPGLSFVRNEPPGEPPSETKPSGEPGAKAQVTWNLGTLAPGQQRVIEYQAIAKEEGTFANRVAVRAA